jgi:hypothetical protein
MQVGTGEEKGTVILRIPQFPIISSIIDLPDSGRAPGFTAAPSFDPPPLKGEG